MCPTTDFAIRPSRRTVLRAALALASLEAARGLLIATSGCAAATTGGRRVTLETRARTDVPGPAVTNAKGWSVTLGGLRIGLVHLAYVTGAPVGETAALTRSSAATLGHVLERFALERTAWAHPGHYEAGTTLGEMAKAQVLDANAIPPRLDRRGGVTGTVGSGIVTLGAIDAGGTCVQLDGIAEKDGRSVAFSLSADAAALADPDGMTQDVVIAGCPFANGVIGADGVVTFWVHASVFVEQVDFDHRAPVAAEPRDASAPETLPSDAALTADGGGANDAGADAGAAPEPIELPVGSPAHNAFVRGVRKAVAYQFSYDAGTSE